MRAIRFVPSGPMESPFDLDEGDLVSREAENGYLYPHDQLTGRSSETIMSYAADVAAFLCMAGASHMDRTLDLRGALASLPRRLTRSNRSIRCSGTGAWIGGGSTSGRCSLPAAR